MTLKKKSPLKSFKENSGIKKDVTENRSIEFISTGSTLLNLSLTNHIDKGYPVGRIVNIVSDYSVGKCIKNAHVLTQKGMQKIDTLVKDQGLFEYKAKIASFKNKIKETSHIYKEEVNKTVKISTQFGFEIEGTEEHPIMLYNPFYHEFNMTKLENVKEGNWAVIQKGMDFFPENPYKFSKKERNNTTENGYGSMFWEPPKQMTNELAKFLGYFVADGSFMPRGLCISNTKDYILKDLNSICEKLNVPFNGDKYISRVQVKNFIHNLFNIPGNFKAKDKFVPNCVLQSTKEHQAMFIQALMDCDSSYDGISSFEYSSASKELITQVQMMLLNFGIFSSKGLKKVKAYPDNDYYRMIISSMDYKTYKDNIGSLKYSFDYTPKRNQGVIPNFLPKIWNHVHEIKEKYDVAKNGRIIGKGIFPRYVPTSGKKKRNASYTDIQRFIDLYSKYTDVSEYQKLLNFHFVKITKKEVIKEKTFVYDFTVPDGHLFWSNGFISHNTLLLCEAINQTWWIEHKQKKKKVKIIYDEPEVAFDMDLARGFNMPLEEIIGLRERVKGNKIPESEKFTPSKQVEQIYHNIEEEVSSKSKYDIILYGVDSMDSVSDQREMDHIKKKGFEKADYGGKAKSLSQFFRTKNQDMAKANVLFFIISQTRFNFNAGLFEKKETRNGGKALDFYSSQIIWLYESKKIEKNGMVQGIEVIANPEKNKVGDRYRKVRFRILHGYGIDDIGSIADWLWDNDGFKKAGSYLEWEGKKLHKEELIKRAVEDDSIHQELRRMIQKRWLELVEDAKIKRKPKYGN